MPVRLRLTDFQLAVAERLRAITGATTYDGLGAEALAHERGRRPDPRWQRPRPPSPLNTERPTHVRLAAILPAATGASLELSAGHCLRVEQIKDGQCVDLGVVATDGRSFSAARTRAAHGIHPSAGASLWSTAPEVRLMSIVADTAPGHDLCFPPCSEHEYELHCGIRGHLGCAELHAAARARRDPTAVKTGDDVLNLWLPSAVGADGRLRSWPVACRTGDFVELRAEADVVVTLSTCPDDLFGSSQYEPGPVRIIVADGHGGQGPKPVGVTAWPTAPPASALARNTVSIALPATEQRCLDDLAASGWLGTSRATVLRALIFRLFESLVSSPAGGDG